MIDTHRLQLELRRVRALVDNDPQASVLLGEETDETAWDRVRQLVVERLERAIEERESSGVTMPAVGRIAHEIYETELRPAESTESPPAIDHARALLIESPAAPDDDAFEDDEPTPWEILAYDPESSPDERLVVTLATVTGGDPRADSRPGRRPTSILSVEAANGRNYTFRQTDGSLTSRLEVSGPGGRPVARIDWLPRPLARRFRVESLVGTRSLTVVGSFFEPHVLTINEEGRALGTIDERCVVDGPTGRPREGCHVELAPDLSLGLRWGLVGAVVLARADVVRRHLGYRLLGR